MTNQVLTTLETAAIPTAIAALKAVQQFEADLGPDPTKWVLPALAAKVKLLSSLQLLVAPLGAAEGAAGLGLLTSVTDGWIGTLQGKLNAAPAASTPAISGIGGAGVS